MKDIFSVILRIIFLIIVLSISGILTSCFFSEDMCWVCAGNGRCYKCYGKIPIDGDPCNVCKESKICFNCNGTGRVPKFH